MNPEEFRQALAKHQIELDHHQMDQFAQYYQDLVTTNKMVNLTRITEENEVYLKHFYDSITGALALPKLQTASLTLCDIGAGAGFPSLPHARAEDFSKKGSPNREHFDVVTARAVARLSVLSELCLPAAKVGGIFLAYKAQAADDEIAASEAALQKLGGTIRSTYQLELPTVPVPEERNLIIIDKEQSTPNKYPRRAGLPAKKPL